MIIPMKVKGKEVGNYNDNKKVYITHRNAEDHYMKKFKGYGISYSIIEKLSKLGCEKVLILSDERDYLFKLEQFEDSLYGHTFNEDDYQKFVSIDEDIEE
jgi:hypothetical protein